MTKRPTPETDPNRSYPYKCRHCGAGFFLLDALEQHLQKHFTDKETPQSISGFKNLNGQEHQIIPQDATTTKTVVEDMTAIKARGDSQKRHQCHICQLEYTTKNYLLVHIGRAHYRDEVCKYFDEKKFLCRICKKKFKTYSHILSHVVGSHRVLDELLSSKVQIQSQSSIKKAKTKALFRDASQRIMDFEETVVQNSLKTDFSNQDKTSLIAPKDHLQVVHREESKDSIHKRDIFYDCNICKQKFGSYSSLVKHFAGDHFPGLEGKQYCQMCQRKFCSESKLYFHLATEHKSLAKTGAPMGFIKKLKKFE